uniref:Putative translation initiation factor eIF-2B subunit alpha (Trinotate prediction) n=1 Tax=Henneguya salminicola TaxID=69463 RepID=A0A6G3MEH8_HENSL
MKDLLKSFGIHATLIIDSAVGYVMERVNAVLVGSEGVVESGGVLNKIGTYQIAVMANSMRVPVFIAVESFKFIRFYPFKQFDLPNVVKYDSEKKESENEHPNIDYTPPEFIKFLITDIGVLTPSGVSDELIKLYM